MVDNRITIYKSKDYAYIQFLHPTGVMARKFVYADGNDLKYGDKAEILSAVMGEDFLEFITSVLKDRDFTKEHYGYTLGFQPADFDNEEIKDDEVRIYYADIENTISKKKFYELCLLLCDAKLNALTLKEKEVDNEKIVLLRLKLREKFNSIT